MHAASGAAHRVVVVLLDETVVDEVVVEGAGIDVVVVVSSVVLDVEEEVVVLVVVGSGTSRPAPLNVKEPRRRPLESATTSFTLRDPFRASLPRKLLTLIDPRDVARVPHALVTRVCSSACSGPRDALSNVSGITVGRPVVEAACEPAGSTVPKVAFQRVSDRNWMGTVSDPTLRWQPANPVTAFPRASTSPVTAPAG